MTVRSPERMRLETITPERALRDLQLGSNVRAINVAQAAALARSMAAGRWRINGETIKYDESNILVDGQHRMKACVMAGVSFQSFVVYGISADDMVEVDTGSKRKPAQLLQQQGVKHANSVAATARLYWMHLNNALNERTNGVCILTTTEIMDILKMEPGLQFSHERVYSTGVATVCSVSVLALIHFCGSKEFPILADAFVDGVASGANLSENAPEFVLRERLIASRMKPHVHLRPVHIRALCIKAWNARVRGSEIKVIKWGSDERFPTPIFSKEDLR